MDTQRAVELGRRSGVLAQEYMRSASRTTVKPSELMPFLIRRGVFAHDNREGKPLRDVLRQLDADGALSVVIGLRVERAGDRRLWYFDLVETAESGSVERAPGTAPILSVSEPTSIPTGEGGIRALLHRLLEWLRGLVG